MFNLIKNFINVETVRFGGNNIYQTHSFATIHPEKFRLVQNIIKIFELHDVARSEIPLFIEEISVKDLISDDTLAQAINQNIIHKICDIFNVKYEWIIGKCDQFFDSFDFYKKPHEFNHFMQSKNIEQAWLIIALEQWMTKKEPNDYNRDNYLILREPIKQIFGRTIYKNYVIHNCKISYWKTRGYLISYLSQLSNNDKNCQCFVKLSNNKFIENLANRLFVNIASELKYGPYFGSHHIEDTYLCPHCFISPVNPEKNYYGYIRGLDFWIELQKGGWINIKYDYKVEEAFKNLSLYYKELSKEPWWKSMYHKAFPTKLPKNFHLPYTCEFNH